MSDIDTAYRPRGACDKLFSTRDPEVLLAGPAGTGKTRALLEKSFAAACKYPGARILLARKTRASMTESVLVTLERDVFPPNSLWRGDSARRTRGSYSLPNGSSIVIGGLDRPDRIMSTEFDIVAAFEATELVEDDWEKLQTRLRNGVMPYQQGIADCNPQGPGHWLHLRAKTKMAHLLSRHEDNPLIWDAAAKDWTTAGREYIAKLDALTGARKLRLRHGVWAVAEGVVYDGYDAAKHIYPARFKVKPEWRRIISVDFGFNHPFVAQWWALRDDVMIRFREIYFTKRLVEDHAKRIKVITEMDATRPEAIVCDHDAEDRATLERHSGMATIAAIKDVSTGIQSVASRLAGGGPGNLPRMMLMPDSLDEVDGELVDAKRPWCTEHEFDCYVWKQTRQGVQHDEPAKENDDGMDAARYASMYFSGGEPERPTVPTGEQAGKIFSRPTIERPSMRVAADDEW